MLVCPNLNKFRIKAVLPILEKAAASKVSITVYTRTPEHCQPEQRDAVIESLALLKDQGISVKTQAQLLHRYAVIDQSIIWYGNIEYLSYSMKDANALRFESPDTMNCWIYGRMRTSRSSCVMTCAMEIFLI